MPVKKQDAHQALELLEEYRKHLQGPENQQLQEALTKAIVAIRSRLFQALLDIQEFYAHTLEDKSKSTESKTQETLRLAERWEQHLAPIPGEATRFAQKTLEETDKGGAENHIEEDWIEETIVLERNEAGGLGVSIAGGVDNPHIVDNPGIFITKIIPHSPADHDGRLQLGDQIVSVNGNTLMNVTHLHSVEVLKDSGKRVTLVVRRRRDRVWTPVSTEAGTLDRLIKTSLSPQGSGEPMSPATYANIMLIKGTRGLGFSIAGGRGNQHVLGDDGIFITKIIAGGAAEVEGTLSVGDRIMQVNAQSMVDVTHDEAVSILKATQDKVTIRVEKNATARVGATAEERDSVTEEKSGEGQRTVVLERPEGTGLGFNIIGGEGDTGIFISFISPWSVADRSGLLKPGDQIIAVNDQPVEEATHEEAADALKGAGISVKLLVEYRPHEFQSFQQKLQRLQETQLVEEPEALLPTSSPGLKPAPVKQLYVRALFDYDSSKDDDRPSQGLSFKHGDILHILNGSDEEWWQAALVGNHADDGPQGLIPGKKRVERRAKANQKSVKFTRAESSSFAEKERKASSSEKRGARSSFKLSRKLPFIKKKDLSASGGTDEPKVEEDHIPTYEPVTLEPRGYARPVIILGPMKEDINDMLVQEFPDKFAGCVPHTTRAPRDGEVDGRDYHFVSSVDHMERDIQAHLFIEAGRYKDNLYGTSIKAVQEVANQGKHCILGVSGYAIRRLQMADLHPIAICIRPSNTDVIQSAQSKNTEEQCRQIFEKGQRIEQEFAEYFTAVVEGESLTDIYNKVKNVIHEQSGNYIWVPSNEPL